ncbi:MAG TPA: EAL domain-containing protein [Acidimicrobiales bacterium]|jgi:diguanylate cyclase (GGDEF)-like protein/PAS domain S-box-containing protein|nr:EAL domain-containing protein [Acidimicrobiales bacterium]
MTGKGDLVARIRRSPLVLSYAIGPPCLVLLLFLRRWHMIAGVSLWVYGAAVLGPVVTSTITNVLYARHPGRVTLHGRAFTDCLATTAAIYCTGWGPALGLVYLVAAQQLVARTNQDTWKIVRWWALAGIVAGQVGIALKIIPTYVHAPADYGAAALGYLAFILVSRMAMTISSDREKAWQEVRASDERFQALLNNSSDMIMLLRDDGKKPVYVSGACERMLGLTSDQLLEVELGDLIHPDEVDSVRAVFAVGTVDDASSTPIEMRVRHANGEWRNLEMVGTNLRDNPAVGGVVVNVRDITERRRVEAELAHHATHDSLTGLPNRQLFLDRLSESLIRNRWLSRRPAVLFLDLDRFKLINDSLGHEIGDQLLVQASRRLRAAAGPEDTVARFGGDEFVVLCEPPGDPMAQADRLLACFEEPFFLGEDRYFMSTSIGVASPEGPDPTPAVLIRDADTAMYRAKELGRGRIQIFDEAARSAAVVRAHTEHLLRGAVERDELRLFYQPVIELTTGRVIAAEALLRWQHPQLGLVGPDYFIDTAEDSGAIVAIGEWVLRTACRQAAVWAERGEPIDMAINLSARQLGDERLIAIVADALESAGDRATITFELTERLLIQEPELVAGRLDDLKGLGVNLSMDDFGTGYSSLSNLRRYPFDSLKIDRRFVAGLSDSEDDGTVVRAIIALAHGLGKTVVAEGVERAEHLALLRQLGCDMAQGYYMGGPQPATLRPSQLLVEDLRLLPVPYV